MKDEGFAGKKEERGCKAVSRRAFLGSAAAAGVTMAQTRPETVFGSESGVTDAVDAHVHVFPAASDRYPLRPGATRDRLPMPLFTAEELFAHTRPAGVARVVLVQFSHYGFDNSYILDTMRRFPGVFAAIGMVDPKDRPDQRIRELAAQGARGLRVSGGGREPDEWSRDEATLAMWRTAGEAGMAICPLVDPKFLPAIGQLCRQFPATRVVIDHLARIGAAGPPETAQVDQLCQLARHKNALVKVSAFYALGRKQAPYLDLAPVIRRVLEAFGPERLMWGSDSPFQVLHGHAYRDSIELVRSRLDFLTSADRRWILRETAAKTFF